MGKLFGISKDGKPPKQSGKFISNDNVNQSGFDPNYNQMNYNQNYNQNGETFVYDSVPSNMINNLQNYPSNGMNGEMNYNNQGYVDMNNQYYNNQGYVDMNNQNYDMNSQYNNQAYGDYNNQGYVDMNNQSYNNQGYVDMNGQSYDNQGYVDMSSQYANQSYDNYNNSNFVDMNNQNYDMNSQYNNQAYSDYNNQGYVDMNNQVDYNQSQDSTNYEMNNSSTGNVDMPLPNINEGMEVQTEAVEKVDTSLKEDNVIAPRGVQPPKEDIVATEVIEIPELALEPATEVEEETEPEKEEILDPLNNANNPIPVNPVAPKDDYVEEELPEDVKANVFSVFNMMIGMFFSPGTTIITNSKKYRSLPKALSVTLWVSVISIIMAMLTRIVVGMFRTSYNSVSGFSSIYLDFANIFNIDNYVPYFIVAIIMTFGAIAIASLVYYASSFLNSKGVHMGTYFMVSSLAMVPVIFGVLVLYPIASIISMYIGLLLFIFTFLYTLISFFLGMNEVLVFGNINKRILYNVINLSLIFLILIIIFVLCFRLNILIPPEIYF
mgnify:CR=1 FL=1